MAPSESPLPQEEREELQEAATRAMQQVAFDEDPGRMMAALEDAARATRTLGKGKRDAAVFDLGALFGALLEMHLGWELVYVSWEGFTGLAAVPLDRSLAILPVHAVGEIADGTDCDLATPFQRLASGERPPGLQRNGYALLLP